MSARMTNPVQVAESSFVIDPPPKYRPSPHQKGGRAGLVPIYELLAKAGDGDFLRAVAEAVVQLLMAQTQHSCRQMQSSG
jgi:hypothetical protein